jgi:hypothetical protein
MFFLGRKVLPTTSTFKSKERGNKEGELLNEKGSTIVMQLRDNYHKRSRGSFSWFLYGRILS